MSVDFDTILSMTMTQVFPSLSDEGKTLISDEDDYSNETPADIPKKIERRYDDIKNWKYISSGSFGNVYIANYIEGDKKGVSIIKQISKIPPHIFNTIENIEKFKADAKYYEQLKSNVRNKIYREINVMQNLQDVCSEYIVCIDGEFEDNDNVYIITEYLDKYITLTEYINSKPIDRGEANTVIKIIINLINGLKLIHSRGIAHRDIKPDNIMINPETGAIKYIDFGLSCMQNTCLSTTSGGTLAFMAPELLNLSLKFEVISIQKTDIFSLGLVIMALLMQIPSGLFPVWQKLPESKGKSIKDYTLYLSKLGGTPLGEIIDNANRELNKHLPIGIKINIPSMLHPEPKLRNYS